MTGTTRTLYIDGAEHEVSQRLWAHFQFLSDLNNRFADKIADLTAELAEAKTTLLDLTEPTAIRWTPMRKEMVVLRARISAEQRRAVLMIFGISGEELDAWTDRYLKHGLDGLSAMRRQTIGDRSRAG